MSATPPITMTINVRLYQQGYGGTISVEEQIELPSTDFLGLAKIMSRFHELAREIQNQAKVAQ
jgi:hypothetical protein